MVALEARMRAPQGAASATLMSWLVALLEPSRCVLHLQAHSTSQEPVLTIKKIGNIRAGKMGTASGALQDDIRPYRHRAQRL